MTKPPIIATTMEDTFQTSPKLYKIATLQQNNFTIQPLLKLFTNHSTNETL